MDLSVFLLHIAASCSPDPISGVFYYIKKHRNIQELLFSTRKKPSFFKTIQRKGNKISKNRYTAHTEHKPFQTMCLSPPADISAFFPDGVIFAFFVPVSSVYVNHLPPESIIMLFPFRGYFPGPGLCPDRIRPVMFVKGLSKRQPVEESEENRQVFWEIAHYRVERDINCVSFLDRFHLDLHFSKQVKRRFFPGIILPERSSHFRKT